MSLYFYSIIIFIDIIYINSVIAIPEEDSRDDIQGLPVKRVPKFNSTCRQFFFSIRVVKVWNALPASCVNSTSLLSFKNNIRKINLSKFLCNDFDNFD